MRRGTITAGTFTFLLGLATLAPLWGQPAENADAEKSPPAARNRFRRLPSYYGRLDLTGEQRDKIYANQVEYGRAIQRLRDEIEDLQIERNEANRAVLTEKQFEQLEDLLAEARERRANRRRARQQEKAADSEKNAADSP